MNHEWAFYGRLTAQHQTATHNHKRYGALRNWWEKNVYPHTLFQNSMIK